MKLTSMQFDGGGEGNYTPPKPLAPTPLAAQESGAIGAASMAAQSGMSSTPVKSTTKAKATKAVDKSGYDRSVKVSQSTVNAVKDAGRGNMGKVPQDKVKNGAPGYNGSTFSPNAPVSKEYAEATKRVYPNAVKAATPKAAPKNYGGPAAEKYKAEEKNAKNKSAFPSILPKPGTTGKLPTPPVATPAKVKVSQATVDAVKKDGKAGSIGKVKNGSPGYVGSTMSPNAPVSKEYKEAVRRVYQSPAKPKPKTKSGGGGGKASAAVK